MKYIIKKYAEIHEALGGAYMCVEKYRVDRNTGTHNSTLIKDLSLDEAYLYIEEHKKMNSINNENWSVEV